MPVIISVGYDADVDEARRVFTFEEARRLLPEVKEKTRLARERLSAVEVSDDSGDGEAIRARAERTAAGILEEWAHEMEALGIEVKGPFLVDFDSGAGYYCWKWPEESLEFFHGYEEGFGGRVRLQ
jgi:hypothetical protein